MTIVTPSFNQARFLDETIRSVLDQDYRSIEYLVLDGGSTDESVEIIKRYDDRLAGWWSEPDAGQVDALTRGFARARGEILGWVNSDDVLLPGAIRTAVAALANHPASSLVYGDNVLIDQDSGELAPLPARPFDVAEMLRTAQNHVPQPGSLFRRDALATAGGLPEGGYYYFDFEFVVRLGLAGGAVRVPSTLAAYRLHDESKSIAADVGKADDLLRMYDAVFSLSDLPPEVRSIESEGRATAEQVAGEYYYAALRLPAARRAFRRSLRRRGSSQTVVLLLKASLPAALIRLLRRQVRQRR